MQTVLEVKQQFCTNLYEIQDAIKLIHWTSLVGKIKYELKNPIYRWRQSTRARAERSSIASAKR
jgi:hypothetical protein